MEMEKISSGEKKALKKTKNYKKFGKITKTHELHTNSHMKIRHCAQLCC